jgi:hypothetical protein
MGIGNLSTVFLNCKVWIPACAGKKKNRKMKKALASPDGSGILFLFLRKRYSGQRVGLS